MDCVASAADAEEGAGRVEGHAVDAGRDAAAAELIQLLRGWNGEDTDDGTFVGGGREESPGIVKADAGEGGAVRLDDVDGLEFKGVKDEDFAVR